MSALPGSSGHAETSAAILLAEIAGYGALVGEIGAALEISAAQLAAVEALERVETTVSLPIERVAGWNGRRVAEWFGALDSDLQIDLRLSGMDSQTTAASVILRAGRDPAGKLHDFIANAESAARSQGNELAIEARVSVAKGRAVGVATTLVSGRAEYFGAPEMLERSRVLVFYHSAAWQRLLSPRALFDWETLGLVREDGRTIVVLCDGTGYLAGFALDVIGAGLHEEPRWMSVSRAAWRQFQERSQRELRLREEESQWADAPHVLTPAHLRVEERQPGLQPSVERLAELRATLAALYLASAVHGEQGELTLRCAGPRRVVCHIALSQDNTDISAAEATYGNGALARLCDWAYDNASPDKLAIARECLAQELGSRATLTLPGLEGAAVFALDAARANLVLYLRRNTELYFRMRQQALDTVSDYAAAVRKAVADLTSDVVDNVYRTVGLLVGVVIAALLQPSLSLDVQRLAAFLYTLYIAFVMVFVLEARRRHFALEAADLDRRLAAMPELSVSELGRLRAQAGSNNAYFERYFRWSRIIYLGLGVVGLIYLMLLLTPLAVHLPLTAHAGATASVTAGRP
ncbi:MAG: hypothetical protein ACXWQ5_21230 [Ktedonobacterales bacterium]